MPTILQSGRRAVASAAVALTLAAGACRFGPSLDTFQPAFGPAGVEVNAWTSAGRRRGELLAVRDTAMLLRVDRRVLLVPWRTVSRFGVRQVGDFTLRREPPARATREQLRLLSRFPQGMTPALERTFLDAIGSDSIEVVR